MAPTRKSRSVNKRISHSNDVSPEKDGVNSNKNKQRVCHDQMVFYSETRSSRKIHNYNTASCLALCFQNSFTKRL